MYAIGLRMSLALFAAVLLVSPCRADLQDLMKAKGRKILFLGDSNTYAGLYIAYVEGYLRTRFPAEPWELINLGLPSETISGLSEPDHPYPRPDIHERVDRALAKIKPNIVFICYGMNDGIYYPFSEKRLAKYKEGTESLVAKLEKAGAKVILMTPSPFDAVPIAKNLLPKDAAKFSWMKPYEKYDSEVLRKYSDYLLEWRKKDYIVVDAHAAVHRFLKAMREKEPKYTVSSDGIHPNPMGHAVIAFEILRELKAPPDVDRIELDWQTQKVIKGNATTGAAKPGASVAVFWPGAATKIMPYDTRWDESLVKIENYEERFNRVTLKVTGLEKGKYAIIGSEERRLASATHQELAQGIALPGLLHPDPFTEKLGVFLRKKQQILGSAWLSDVGFIRPGTPKGLSLHDARKQAAQIDLEIKDLGRQSYEFQLVKQK